MEGAGGRVLINRLFQRIHSSTGSSVVSTIYVPLQFAPLSLGARCATIPRTVTVRVKFCFLSINAILNLALVGPRSTEVIDYFSSNLKATVPSNLKQYASPTLLLKALIKFEMSHRVYVIDRGRSVSTPMYVHTLSNIMYYLNTPL